MENPYSSHICSDTEQHTNHAIEHRLFKYL